MGDEVGVSVRVVVMLVRDRLRTGSRGMDSAFPVGWRRGPIANIMSNPPVPPRDFSTAARWCGHHAEMASPEVLCGCGRQAAPGNRDAAFFTTITCFPTARRRDVRGTRQQQTPPTDPLFLDRCHTNRGTRDLVDVRDKREGRRVLQNGSVLPSPRPGSWRKWWSFLLSPPLLWCVTDLLRVVSREPGLFRLARDKNHRYFFPQLLLTEVRPRAVWEVATGWRAGLGGYDDRPSAGDATDWGLCTGGVGFHGQTPRSPKVRRTQQRSQVPVGQGAVAVGGHPEGEAGVLTC
ncbi:hypothetical protein Q5P01_014242 [Channa striata]|uniref:Uncharacterized protein n=1 Tax=Channa striata TaxID=64152 RepID=A0AA88MNV0_CHASR|nr:hypothetical protein Q5P01_014242 [Channa striata]